MQKDLSSLFWSISCKGCFLFIHLFIYFLFPFIRFAQSARRWHLHRACARCATSGCVASARMCISIRKPQRHLCTRTCTTSTGLNCPRKALAPFRRLDQASRLSFESSFEFSFLARLTVHFSRSSMSLLSLLFYTQELKTLPLSILVSNAVSSSFEVVKMIKSSFDKVKRWIEKHSLCFQT